MNNAQVFLFLLFCILNWWAGFSCSHCSLKESASEQAFYLIVLPVLIQVGCIIALIWDLGLILYPIL